MNEKSLAIGSTVAAFVASLCCLGPLILGGAGLGAAFVATFAPLRPYLLAVSAILLGLGFYFLYRKPKPVEACEGEVCVPGSATRRWAKPILWLATLMVAALALFPFYGAKLVPTPKTAPPAVTGALKNAELKINGMVCEACAGVVKGKLLGIPGVAEAKVDYPAGRATIKYNPAQTDTGKLIEAVDSTGYKASVLDSWEN